MTHNFYTMFKAIFNKYALRGVMAAAPAAVFLFNSCMESTVFHAYQPVEKEGWSKHDTICFQLPEDSVTDIYKINIGLRTTDDYKYTSLWIVIEQDLEKKGTFTRDTINFPVTDKYGNMLGKGYSSYQQEKPVEDIRVTPAGGTTVKLYHIMKREVVGGISDVGINVLSDSLLHQSEGK